MRAAARSPRACTCSAWRRDDLWSRIASSCCADVAGLSRLSQYLQHCRMHATIRGDDLVAASVRLATAPVGDVAACLAHEEHAGGDVPRLEFPFPETFEAAARDVGEIGGCGAVAADGLRA